MVKFSNCCNSFFHGGKDMKCLVNEVWKEARFLSIQQEFAQYKPTVRTFVIQNLYNMSVHKNVKRVTTHVLQEMKNSGQKISMLTGYDFSMARISDSASNVMAGHETTLPITLDQMIYHASSVVRAVERALVVVDMPFGSYQGNSKEAL